MPTAHSRSALAPCLQVLDLVDLAPLRGSLVGLPGISGLSVEQRKRLTIAVELVGSKGCTGFGWRLLLCRVVWRLQSKPGSAADGAAVGCYGRGIWPNTCASSGELGSLRQICA